MKKGFVYFISPILLMACSTNTDSITDEEYAPETEEVISEEYDYYLDEEWEDWKDTAFGYDLKGFENLDFHAYIDDPDTKGPTNIRDKPKGKVLVELERNDAYMVHIVGQKDGWFEIDFVEPGDPNNAIDIPMQNGWIHHSVLGLTSRNYGAQKVPVYLYPDETKLLIGEITERETELRFDQIYYDFVHVSFKDKKGKKIQGWIKKEWVCGSAFTTCS